MMERVSRTGRMKVGLGEWKCMTASAEWFYDGKGCLGPVE
jgi:hypothetical protein